MSLPPIKIVLTADPSGARVGIGAVDRALDGLQGSASGASRRMSMLGDRIRLFSGRATLAAGAVAGLAGGMLVLLNNAAQSADRVGEAAKSAGVATKYYQEMGFAIQSLTGATQEDFDKALITLNKRLGEAQQGSKSATEAFEAVGISQEDLMSGAVSTQQAMDALVKKLGETKDPALAAALASDLLGKSGAKMGGAMAGASAEVASLVARAQELGIAFGPEALDAASRFDDRMRELYASFSGLMVVIAEKILPVLVDEFLPFLTDKLIPGIKNVVGAVTSWIDWFNALPTPVRDAANLLEKLFNNSSPLQVALHGVGLAFDMISTAVTAMVNFSAGEITRLVGMFAPLLTVVQQITDGFANMWSNAPADMNAAGGYSGMAGGMDGGADMFGAGSGGSQSSSTFAIGQNNADGLINGFAARMTERQAEISAALGMVTTAAQDVFETHSPSEVFRRIGAFIGDGLAGGISDSQAVVTAAVKNMGAGAVAANDDMVSGIMGGLNALFSESKSVGEGLALVSGLIGAAKELEKGTFGWATALKTLALAKAFASSIKGAGKGGAGGSAGGGGGAAAAGPASIANITLVGDTFSRGSVEDLFAQINSGIRSGRTINSVRA